MEARVYVLGGVDPVSNILMEMRVSLHASFDRHIEIRLRLFSMTTL
jgi:hypothetical protein